MTVVIAPEDSQLRQLMDQVKSEPVFLEREDGEAAVLLSAKEYERMRGEAEDDLWALADKMSDEAEARGFTEEKLNEILAEIKAERRG